HAHLLAERLGGTDAGAHTAEDVLVEDGLGGAERIAGRYLPDEQRDIDGGGTGRHARRVVAEVAAVGCDQRLMLVETRVKIGKIGCVFAGRQAASLYPASQSFHLSSLFYGFYGQLLDTGYHRSKVYQTVKK